MRGRWARAAARYGQVKDSAPGWSRLTACAETLIARPPARPCAPPAGKKALAISQAGPYDEAAVRARIEALVADNGVVVFR